MACSSARVLLPLALVAAAAPADLRALAAADLRVATIAYRLQTAGAPACADRARLPGMVVQDVSQYRADLRPVAARLLGLGRLPAITGVVPGGPAARAGLAAGDAIVALDGRGLAAGLPPVRPAADGARFTAIAHRIDAAFARGPVRVTIARRHARRILIVAGEPACGSLVQLGLGADRNAGADGRTVTVSRGLVDFVASDDELAVAIGHELAHNILRQPLAAPADDRPAARADREAEADYLGLYLAAWAGYDVDAAAPFWRRMASTAAAPALFPDASHPPTEDRARALDRAAREIAAQRAAGRRPVPDYEAFARGG